MSNNQRLSTILASCLIVAGCAAGPDFVTPPPPEVSAYTTKDKLSPTESADTMGGAAQRFLPNGEVPANWWTLFGSADINNLVEQGNIANPSVQSAEASLRSARENVAAVSGALWPQITGQAGVTPQLTIDNGAADRTFTLYNAGVQVAYTVDFSGLTRRSIERGEATTEYQRFQLAAARTSISANIVTAAIAAASLSDQIIAIRDNIAASEKQLELLERQFNLGAVAKSAVLDQEAELAATRTTLPALENSRDAAYNQLRLLIGKMPQDALAVDFHLASLKLPEEVPIGIPSKLVANRPDVRAAEAQLQAASAAIGIAYANMLPQFTLTAAFGSQSTSVGDFASPAATMWSLGAGVLQPLFRGGELRHRARAAEADYEAALATYRGTVLSAFSQVADALRTLESDAAELKAQTESERAAKSSLMLAQAQFEAGSVSYLTLLDADRRLQQAKVGVVKSRGQRYANTAALFQALGGGWKDTNHE